MEKKDIKLTPIVLEYQKDLGCTLAVTHTDDGYTKVIKLSQEELVELKNQADKIIAKRIKTDGDNSDTLTISSSLYQGFMKLAAENEKLKTANKLLKEELGKK